MPCKPQSTVQVLVLLLWEQDWGKNNTGAGVPLKARWRVSVTKRATLPSTQPARYLLRDRFAFTEALQFDFASAALMLNRGIAYAMAGCNPEPFKNPQRSLNTPLRTPVAMWSL